MKKTFTNYCKVLFQIVLNLTRQFEVLNAVLLNRRLSQHPSLKPLALAMLLLVAPPAITASLAQQTITVSGTVTDASDSSPVPGVSIQDAGKKGVGITDINGKFTVRVPAGTPLTFSFLGYNAFSATYVSNQVQVNIRMVPATKTMNEVTVTALGIKRETKSLGYATTTVDSTALTDAVSSNWTDALSGKVAGLNLVRNSGPAGSNKIILRGENNLTGDNEALIVIDGVVASASSSRKGSATGGVYGTGGDNMPVDYGSAMNDINPEDIESVTVLKGPGASALYGQRGANGAVLITTKSASSKRKKMGITFTTTGSMDEINRRPDMQTQYGQGLNGASYFNRASPFDSRPNTNSTSSAWGPKFDGQYFYQYDPVTQATGLTPTLWRPYDNPIDVFFKTGYDASNTVSFDGNVAQKVPVRVTLNHNNNSWIAPNNDYQRTSATLTFSSKIAKKLQISGKANYNNKTALLPTTGFGNQSIMYWSYFSQPNVDPNVYREYWERGNEYKKFINITTTTLESPWGISYEYLNPQRRNALTGSMTLAYELVKGLTVQGKTSLDYNRDIREQLRPYDAAGSKFPNGSFRHSDGRTWERNTDVMVKYDKKLTKDITLLTTVGASTLRFEYQKGESRADGLKVPNIYELENNLNGIVEAPDTSRYQFNSVYGLISASYKDYLFLDVTGRQDWSSVLASPIENADVGFFYPSVNMSFVPSDLWELPKSFNLVKLRASYSQVGSGGTTAYRTSYTYLPASNGIYGNSTANPLSIPARGLKPLITTTIEIGTDIRMFKNRLNIDVALYTGNTKNQILSRVVDRSSGYASAIINAGRVNNRGIEIGVNGTPLILGKGKNAFKWTASATFAANRNKIKELLDSSVVLRNNFTGNGQVVANIGGSMGDMYGVGFLRAPDGQIVFENGLPATDPNPVFLGNALAKFKTGLSNTFAYKGFSLSALFDAQFGGMGHAFSFARIAENGKHAITLQGRYNGVTGNGVIKNPDGSYRQNDVIATDLNAYYKRTYYDNAEGAMFSTDFLKFREASLNYGLPTRFVKKMGLNKVTVGGYGRNLYIWSKWPVFDPEFGSLSGNDIVTGFEVGQLPSTRTYGFKLVVGI